MQQSINHNQDNIINSQFLILEGSYADYRIKRSIISDTTEELYELTIEKPNDSNYITRKFNTAQFKYIVFNDYGPMSVFFPFPLPVDDVLNLEKGNQVNFSASDLLANDYDLSGSKLSIGDLKAVNGGYIDQKNGTYSFNLFSDFKGIPKFSYTIKNGNGYYNTSPAFVTIKLPHYPNDKLFHKQWYLDFINLMPIWEPKENNYSGKNIKVAVLDEGFIPKHRDLEKNLHPSEYFFKYDHHIGHHALNVASIIAAEKNNDDFIGIAYNSSIFPYQCPFNQFHKIKLDFLKEYDIVNNSWGGSPEDSQDPEEAKIIHHIERKSEEAVKLGRGGLGTIIVNSSGNSGENTSNPNVFGSNPYHIAVGAINKPKDLLSIENHMYKFSSTGANVLISAPGSNIPLLSIDDVKFNNDNKITYKDIIKENVAGTSFSAPIVSGVVALMLEANPKLTWIDVRNILSFTAAIHQTNFTECREYRFNQANDINGIGLHHSNEFGFGKINAEKAIKMAETWPISKTNENFLTTITPIERYEYTNKKDNENLYQIEFTQNLQIEFVTLNIIVSANKNEALPIYLISPSGTSSLLSELPSNYLANAKWELGSAMFLNEESLGTWKIAIKKPDENAKEQNKILSASLVIYGQKTPNAQEQIIINDEFVTFKNIVIPAKNKFDDTEFIPKVSNNFENSKAAILNLSALSYDAVIDLSKEQPSLINNIPINFSNKINTVVLGDGNDVFYGNDQPNTIYPGRGNDEIHLGNSESKIIYHSLNSTIGFDQIDNFTKGKTKFIIKHKNFSDLEALDKIVSFNIGKNNVISVIQTDDWSITVTGNDKLEKSDFIFE